MKRKILSIILACAMVFVLIPALPATTTATTPSGVTPIPVTGYPTPEGYNANDYQKLVAFFTQNDTNKAIIEELGWDLEDPETWAPPEGNVWLDIGISWDNEAIKRVTGINIRNLDLEGSLDVSDFTALFNLFCNQNKITELDVSNNTALKSLDVRGNRLTELDVSNNTALISLDVSWNQLTELDVSNNVALVDLRCSYNKLTKLDVSQNIALTRLYVLWNQLTELDVSNNIALTDLQGGANYLAELNVSKNTALEFLCCGNNQLAELDVSNNTALRYLDVSWNQLTELDVSNNIALTQISVSHNQLTQLDLSNNILLSIISCDWNSFTNISFLEDLENLMHASVDSNLLDLKCPDILTSIKKIQQTIDRNIEEGKNDDISGGGFYYEPQGRVIDEKTLDKIILGKVTVHIVLKNGKVIMIDPTRITADARETNLHIDIEVVSTGNNEFGVPANSIVILPADKGEFGFEISFIISAEELEEAGLKGASARLWHIDDKGNMVEDGRIERNADGSVTVGITRASFYVILPGEVSVCPACGEEEEDCVCIAINVTGDATAKIHLVGGIWAGNTFIEAGNVDLDKLSLTVSKVAEPENTEKFFAALKEYLTE